MTVSRWRTCSATTRSTTRPTARTIATAPTTTTATIAAMKARPTIRRSSRCAASLRKNQLACLLLAQGLPLILAGDEVGNTPERQQQRLLPGQRNRLGRLGRPRPRRRRPHRFHRPHDRAAPAISANPLAALARRTARRRLLRRAVADAVGRGDEGAGLEFSGRPVSRLCAGPDRARAGADLHRAERRTRGDRVQTAEDAGIQELAAGAEHRATSSRPAADFASGSEAKAPPRSVLAFAGSA